VCPIGTGNRVELHDELIVAQGVSGANRQVDKDLHCHNRPVQPIRNKPSLVLGAANLSLGVISPRVYTGVLATRHTMTPSRVQHIIPPTPKLDTFLF
jgi:hypothetical protein